MAGTTADMLTDAGVARLLDAVRTRTPDTVISVPTFNPRAEKGEPETSEPSFPVKVRDTGEGVRIILGESAGQHIEDAPNIFIERQAGKWLVMVHADSTDPIVVAEIPDANQANAAYAGCKSVLYDVPNYIEVRGWAGRLLQEGR